MRNIFFLILFISFSGMAQDAIVPLWDEVPNAKSSELKEIIEKTDSRRISKVLDPTIEVYLPSGSHASGKAVVICPGGGYARLSYDKEGTDLAKWLNGHGVAGIVLKYRLPEDESNTVPYESPLMDAKRAMELVRTNAEEWNIDPNKVGIMGFSAGGHLASTLATHFTVGNRPDFAILIYPVVTMKNDFTHQGSRINLLGENPSDDLVELYSNELQVTEATPPTFLVHSEDDRAVPVENSIQFYLSLKENNVPSEMHLYPYGGHGYALALGKGRLSEWNTHLISWLDQF